MYGDQRGNPQNTYKLDPHARHLLQGELSSSYPRNHFVMKVEPGKEYRPAPQNQYILDARKPFLNQLQPLRVMNLPVLAPARNTVPENRRKITEGTPVMKPTINAPIGSR